MFAKSVLGLGPVGWTPSPILADFNFAALPPGAATPSGYLLAPCASASRTVQTGTGVDQSKYPVSSGIAADVFLIGREQNDWEYGHVLEGPVVNVAPTPRTFTGWTIPNFIANQGVGTDSPDGAYNSPALQTASANTAGYYRSNRSSPSFTFWQRQYGGGQPRRSSLYIVGSTVAAVQSGNNIPTWGKYILQITSAASTQIDAMLLDGYSVAGRYGSASASNVRMDLALLEDSQVSHEFYDGSKLGAGLTIDASKVVMGGRIGLYFKGRPKGSVNGANPWTYNPYILYLDANNNVLFNAITGIVTVTIAGNVFNCPVPINFSRAQLVEIWIEAGGGSLATVVKMVVGGIVTILGVSPAPQGVFPATGTLGIGCKPTDLTTGQFESWVNRLTFYSPGNRPEIFAFDPYKINFDFTGLASGLANTNIAARNPLPGQNLLGYSQDCNQGTWSKSGVTIGLAAGTAPDNTNTANSITESATNATHTLFSNNTLTAVSSGSVLTVSVYVKYVGRQYMVFGATNVTSKNYPVLFDVQNGTVVGNATGYINYEAPSSASITSVGNGWYRLSVTFINTTSRVSFLLGMSNTGNVAGPFSYLGDGSTNNLIWGAQLEMGATANPYVANATATPTGALTFTCATAGRTVQTADDVVAAAIAANLNRVGRERSSWLNGLVIEGAVTNNSTPDLAGWSARTSYTRTTGRTDPAGGTAGITILNGGNANLTEGFFTDVADASLTHTWTVWTKNVTSASLSLTIFNNASGTNKANYTTTALPVPWTKQTLIGVTDTNGARPEIGTRGVTGNVGVYGSQFEVGKVSHELITGTKAIETLSTPVASAVVNGRLGFYCRFRPKFSSAGGANPITFAPRLWAVDNTTTAARIETNSYIVVIIGGVTATSTVAIPTWNRGDDVQIFLEAGNGQCMCWVVINNNITAIPFGDVTQPPIAGTTLSVFGTLDGNRPLEAWHATFRTYASNKRPLGLNPNVLLSVDFTSLQAGGVAAPTNMSVTCATSSRAVQVGSSQIISGITNDVLMIGRENSAWALGAVLEGAVTNLVTTPRTLTGWSAGTGTTTNQATGVDSPDNTTNSAQNVVTTTQFGKYTITADPGAVPVNIAIWTRDPGGSPRRSYVVRNAVLTDDTGNTSTTWEKRAFQLSSAGTTFGIGLNEGRASNGFATPTAATVYVDFVQAEAGLISHEWIAASKVGTVHSFPAASYVSANRLSLHVIMRPKGSINGTTNWTWNPYLWRIDANNYCQLNVSTGVLTSVVAGDVKTLSTGIVLARGDLFEFFVATGSAAGNVPGQFRYRINNGALQSLTLTQQDLVPASGNIGVGCDPASPATGSFEGWYYLIEFYASGTTPPGM